MHLFGLTRILSFQIYIDSHSRPGPETLSFLALQIWTMRFPMKAPINTPQEKPSMGGVLYGFYPCFLTVIRLNPIAA
jgi:hypothetical protein